MDELALVDGRKGAAGTVGFITAKLGMGEGVEGSKLSMGSKPLSSNKSSSALPHPLSSFVASSASTAARAEEYRLTECPLELLELVAIWRPLVVAPPPRDIPLLPVVGTGVLAGDGLLLGCGDTACGCISPVTSFFVMEDTAQPAQVSDEGVDGVGARPLGLSRPPFSVTTIAESGF